MRKVIETLLLCGAVWYAFDVDNLMWMALEIPILIWMFKVPFNQNSLKHREDAYQDDGPGIGTALGAAWLLYEAARIKQAARRDWK